MIEVEEEGPQFDYSLNFWSNTDESLILDDRDPIELEFYDFTQNGELTLIFSENMMPIDYFADQGITLANMSLFLDLSYQSMSAADNQPKPRLLNFEAKNFTSYMLVLHLNFSDPLYVSSTTRRDTLSITILGNRLFLASSDLYQLAQNY